MAFELKHKEGCSGTSSGVGCRRVWIPEYLWASSNISGVVVVKVCVLCLMWDLV